MQAIWVVGICERGGDSRFFVVRDRSVVTLLSMIQHYVSENTTLICTSGWGAYNGLENLRFSHGIVIHK